MVESSVVGALVFAASAGVATFFAPCAFPLLPGYVGYYLSENDGDTRMLAPAVAAAGGALGALAVVALFVLAVGKPVKTALSVLEPVVGAGLIVFGIATLLNRGPRFPVPLPERPSSVAGFGVFGAGYAVAAAGCVVPLLFGVVSQALALPIHSSALVLTVYASGMALPLVGVTLLAGVGIDSWSSLGKYSRRVQQVAAVMMVFAGGGQMYLAVFQVSVL